MGNLPILLLFIFWQALSDMICAISSEDDMQISQTPPPVQKLMMDRTQTSRAAQSLPESTETTRLKARTEVLSAALQRLQSVTPTTGVSAIITGGFTASGGVSVLMTGRHVDALITDDPGSVPPWVYYNDAKRADQVTVDAGSVDDIYTAGGDDVVTIRSSGAVTAVSTGNDSDSLSITADIVDGVSLDVMEDPAIMASGVIRDGDDIAELVGRLVSAVNGGGGNDQISVMASERGEASGGAGDDTLVVTAPRGGADGGDGNDLLILDLGRGETEGDLFTGSGFAAGTAPDHAAFRTDVYGGAGDDVIRATIGTQLGIEGGAGDDNIRIANGRGALVWAAGDGNDTVQLGAGAEVVLRLEGITGYSVERDATSLTLRLGSGSIRFDGLDQSGFVAVSLGWSRTEVLHPGRPTSICGCDAARASGAQMTRFVTRSWATIRPATSWHRHRTCGYFP
jgi:hypothetical protein